MKIFYKNEGNIAEVDVLSGIEFCCDKLMTSIITYKMFTVSILGYLFANNGEFQYTMGYCPFCGWGINRINISNIPSTLSDVLNQFGQKGDTI